jgi:hypothetical protein
MALSRASPLAPTIHSIHSPLSPPSSPNPAFIFTNVLSALSWNFSQDTVPRVLKNAPQFHLDNPLALQKKYLDLACRGDQSKKNVKTEMREHIMAGEQKALEMMVKFFDWLDYFDRAAADSGDCPPL